MGGFKISCFIHNKKFILLKFEIYSRGSEFMTVNRYDFDRVHTVPYPNVFQQGPFWSTAQRTVLF
jgi:hypothetical protein